MRLPALPWYAYGGAAALVVLAGYVVARRASGDRRPVSELIGAAVASGVVNAGAGAVKGAASAANAAAGELVQGGAAVVGVPRTDAARCQAAKAAGDTFGASQYCPASDFLAWSANRVTAQTSKPVLSGPSNSPVGRPLLREGDRGPAVAALQRRLGIEADGLFGTVTGRGVRNFQARNGLAVDGIVGADTWSALERGDILTKPW